LGDAPDHVATVSLARGSTNDARTGSKEARSFGRLSG
jgi:hypothetical protein